ncbi:unnamed protein product [Chrysoparadoxa australica]
MDYLLGKGPSGFGSASTAMEVASQYEDKSQSVSTKIFLITGANVGIGLETARALFANGGTVIMACRSKAAMSEAAESIKQSCTGSSKAGTILEMECDLSSMESVRAFAKAFIATKMPVHALICNAGIMAPPDFLTSADGWEMQIATNHLGHFLLVNLLRDQLKAAGTSRVVCVSSMAHKGTPSTGVDYQSLKQDAPHPYAGVTHYCQSKLANMLHAQELSKRCQAQGVNCVAVSLHPGVINSALGRHRALFKWLYWIGDVLRFTKSIEQGAATNVYCALATDVTPGRFYADCNEQETPHAALSEARAVELWEFSSEATKSDWN